MSLSNTSQLLLRNIDHLNANSPLFINLNADGFFEEYASFYPQAKVSCYNNNFEQYQKLSQQLKGQNNSRFKLNFSAQYQSEILHDLIVISFPKSKAELKFTFAMICEYLSENATVIIVGENKGGIKSANKLTSHFLSYCNKLDAARHCILFQGEFNNIKQSFNLDDWYKYYTLKIAGIQIKIASLPGVFSQDGLDKGTELLLNNLPEKLTGKVLDFGCGAGVIACFIGKKYNNSQLTLIDISALALQSAERTLAVNGLQADIFPSNSLAKITDKYQHIVSNPPFHQGLKTHYVATESFLNDIKAYITNKGSITIVANSFLRYQPIMEKSIGKTQVITKAKGFTIYQCNL